MDGEDENEEQMFSLLEDDSKITQYLLDISERSDFPSSNYDALLYPGEGISAWIPTNRSGFFKRKKTEPNLTTDNVNGKKFIFSPNSVEFFDWKSVLEPDTFRHVLNGSYLRGKTEQRTAKNNTNNWKLGVRRVSRQMTCDQRMLQKEIRRDLKKELSHEKTKSNISQSKSQIEVNKPKPPSPFVINEQDVTASLRALDLPNMLTRSFAEKIVENFSSKIVALEDEIKKDMQNKLKKRRQTEPADKRFVSDLELLNNSKKPTKNGNKYVPKLDTITQETFHIQSMLKQNISSPGLRPLTKVTPTQRMCEDNHKILLTQYKYTNPDRKAFSESASPAPHAEVPPCTYAWSNDTISNSNETQDTSGASMTKTDKFAKLEEAIFSRAITKIIPQKRETLNNAQNQNNKMKNKKPPPVSSNHHSAPLEHSTMDDPESSVHSYLRKASIPRSHNTVAAMFLPELSGKRMEIAATNQRIT